MNKASRPGQPTIPADTLRHAPDGERSTPTASATAAFSARRRRCLAALDVGTNSIRLLVVSVRPDDHSFSVVSDRKEVVRLGEGEYAHNLMTPEAMDRAATVITRFAEVARGFGAQEILAVATSAVREAENRDIFLERVRRESGLEVRIISGLEEARLVYLGVVAGLNLQGKKALFMDVGGGSTELAVGDRHKHYLLESLKLGTIRLTNRFLGDGSRPVSRKKYSALQEYVRAVAVHAVRKVGAAGFDLMVGSSGTAVNLGEMVAALRGERPATMRHYTITLREIQRIRETLCRLPLEERRKVPGIKPERADIIVAGVAVIETLMQETGAADLQISEQGLRDGLVIDRLLREDGAREVYLQTPPRRRSVLKLARACGYEAEHCEQVRRLCVQLFDQMRALGLHSMDGEARELLEYAAYLHDTGFFLSHTDHHQHAYYIIRNSELLGFNDREQAILANLALYHRKAPPRKKHPNFAALDPEARSLVEQLSTILRLAEGLDRSHLSLVRGIRLEQEGPGALRIVILSPADCQLELWGVENQLGIFRSVFKRRVTVRVERLAGGNGSRDSVS
ncbi:MAG: metal-dependent phosphohydrolase [Armatimonadota bacterium]|nr:MAG: metal-dependent phosphohydrolase [Armatimonadota bacterium]